MVTPVVELAAYNTKSVRKQVGLISTRYKQFYSYEAVSWPPAHAGIADLRRSTNTCLDWDLQLQQAICSCTAPWHTWLLHCFKHDMHIRPHTTLGAPVRAFDMCLNSLINAVPR